MTKKARRSNELTFNELRKTETAFAERKKGRFQNIVSDFLFFAPGLRYDLSKLGPAGGVNYSDSDFVETGELSAKKHFAE